MWGCRRKRSNSNYFNFYVVPMHGHLVLQDNLQCSGWPAGAHHFWASTEKEPSNIPSNAPDRKWDAQCRSVEWAIPFTGNAAGLHWCCTARWKVAESRVYFLCVSTEISTRCCSLDNTRPTWCDRGTTQMQIFTVCMWFWQLCEVWAHTDTHDCASSLVRTRWIHIPQPLFLPELFKLEPQNQVSTLKHP